MTLWNRKTRERILRIAESMQGAVALGFSPGGGLLAIGRYESLEVWSIESGARLLQVKCGASSLLWSLDGGWLATSSWAGRHSQLVVYRAGSWSNPLRPPDVWRASRWLTDSEVLPAVRIRRLGRPEGSPSVAPLSSVIHMKPRDRVLEELEPLVAPMSELGFKLRRSGALTFHRETGPKRVMGSFPTRSGARA